MKVLHINVSYIGSALHQTMIDHMNRLSIESRVFVPTYDKSKLVVEEREYATVVECFKKIDRFFYYRKQKKIYSAVLQKYDVSRFDIIHAYTLFSDGNTAMRLAKKFKKPFVVAIRNTDVNYFFKKVFFLRKHGVKIMKSANAIFFLSPVYRDFVLKKYVSQEDQETILKKCFIIPNGIDDFWHNNTYKKDGSKVFERIKHQKIVHCLHVGNVDKNKNIELTLKALSELFSEGWLIDLKVIGKIVDQNVFKQISEYPLMHYFAPKNKEELINDYRDADIFVMPSHTETFGLVYAEAMSQGLPVVYTKGQGFDKQFPDGQVGFAVSDNSVDEVKEAIKRICDQYIELSNQTVEAAKKFNWDFIVKEYEQIYIKDTKSIENP